MPAWPYAGTAVCGHGDGREQETRASLDTEQPDSGNYAGLATRAPCRRRWCAAWHEDEDERGRERRGRRRRGAGTPMPAPVAAGITAGPGHRDARIREVAGHALLAGAMQRKKPEQENQRGGEQGTRSRGHHGGAAAGRNLGEQRAAGDVVENLAQAAAGACERTVTGARAQTSKEKQARIFGMPERRAHSWSGAGMHACGRPRG
jgi:hypothetical protein